MDKEFELVGTLLGLAIYNGVILDVQFPRVLYKKLHDEAVSCQDLAEIEPEIARSLQVSRQSASRYDMTCRAWVMGRGGGE